MPVPGGEITTTEIWQAPVEEPVEDYAASLEPDFLTKELVEDSTIYMDITLPTESEKVITIQEAIAEIKKEASE